MIVVVIIIMITVKQILQIAKMSRMYRKMQLLRNSSVHTWNCGVFSSF